MIRVESTDLDAKVDAADATWRARATAYAAKLKALGTCNDEEIGGVAPPRWSEIKSAFMDLQGNKCAFCERALETPHELDVEHFRPKNAVKAWPGPPAPPANGLSTGYYWLAYDIENYCVACKPCNSGLKANFFPIGGSAGVAHDDIPTLNATEKPLLLFPFGDRDVDPETIIGWVGLTPVPCGAPGTAVHRRGEVNIQFFDLADRELLNRERAVQILVLWSWLDAETDPSKPQAQRDKARTESDRYLRGKKVPMRACLRAFAALARADRQQAVELVTLFRTYTLYAV